LSGQEPEGKGLLRRLSGPAGRFTSRIHLGQGQPGMVEKGPARRSQFHAASVAAQQINPDLILQVPNLTAQ
jgi:hypothetical protein